jgi:hypothetical protein
MFYSTVSIRNDEKQKCTVFGFLKKLKKFFLCNYRIPLIVLVDRDTERR